jgi:hypothetical protein
MKIEINEMQLKNLMVFLDRVSIKGLAELQAMNEVLNALNTPVVEEVESKKIVQKSAGGGAGSLATGTISASKLNVRSEVNLDNK